MRLSRTDLLPVLTIVAGGVLGASLSFGFLGSRSGEMPEVERRQIDVERRWFEVDRAGNVTTFEPVQASPEDATCFFNGAVYRFRTVDGDPEWVELSSDGQRIASSENLSLLEQRAQAALLCIDGVEEEAATQYLLQLASVGPRIVDNMVAEDIEDVEVLLSAAAVRRYGEEASSGAIVLTLKEDRPGR